MGNSESQPQGVKSALGLHILRVAEGSPAADAGLEVWFEYIVGFDGQRISEDTEKFSTAIEKAENRRITLQVWSSKRQELRDVQIVPARAWSTGPSAAGSTSTDDDEPSLLGLSLRLCTVDAALDRVWHILDVIDGSPAQDAGLVPYTDYVIGSAEGVLRSEGDFYHLVESHVDKPLRLFCWNSDLDVLRQVIIVPNRSWGDGKGLLGAGVGFGLLHRIPKPSDRPAVLEENDIPDDDEFEEATLGQQSRTTARGAVSAYEDDDPEWAASAGVSVVPVDEPRGSISPARMDGRMPGRGPTTSTILEED